SPDWKPIAPELQEHPRQVDLLANPQRRKLGGQFADAVLPAGMYGQMRLRLAVAPANEQLGGTNRCRGQTLHCGVTADGRGLALQFLKSTPSILVRPANSAGLQLYVPPGGSAALTIELDADRSFLLPLGESVLFGPAFHVNVQRNSSAPES